MKLTCIQTIPFSTILCSSACYWYVLLFHVMYRFTIYVYRPCFPCSVWCYNIMMVIPWDQCQTFSWPVFAAIYLLFNFFTMPVFVCCCWCKSVSCSHQNIYITTSTCYFHNSFVSVCLCACQCFVFNCIQVKRSDIYIYIYLWRFCWEENQNNKKLVVLVEMCSCPSPVSSDMNFTIFVFQEHIIYINVKSCWYYIMIGSLSPFVFEHISEEVHFFNTELQSQWVCFVATF